MLSSFEEDVSFTAFFKRYIDEYLPLHEKGWLEHATLFSHRTVARLGEKAYE